MARLLQAADVEAAHAQGRRKLCLPPGALVTPLARERARDLGVQVLEPAEDWGVASMCCAQSSCPHPGGRPAGCTPAAAAASEPAVAAPAAGGSGPGLREADVRRVVAGVILKVMPEAFSPVLVRQVTERVMQQLRAGGG